MSSNEIAGSFLALRGENCNFTQISGVRTLQTENGTDLIAIANKLDSLLTNFENRLKNIEQKLMMLETRPVATGKGGKTAKLEDVGDVDLTGLIDGGILTWSSSSKKWVVAATD